LGESVTHLSWPEPGPATVVACRTGRWGAKTPTTVASPHESMTVTASAFISKRVSATIWLWYGAAHGPIR